MPVILALEGQDKKDDWELKGILDYTARLSQKKK